MNALVGFLRNEGARQARVLAGPVLILLVLMMMVLPLAPLVLDLFFTFNISLAVMILLVAMFTRKPLDFAAFPSVLLFATLLRLALNVASARVVLMHGHKGPDAAGQVIEAFGHFLVGGNFAVGLIVFIILVIINFIVITKGAGRIAEVGARFTLDAMPGKQMAIDADLNAGLIGEGEARSRRQEVSQEAEFYGSMDGASKFVRGDAVAGLLIMVLNIIGGLVVGVGQHGLDFSEAGRVYTLLTIGDGLVAQIPALIISTAAGVVVSRVATDQDIGQQMMGQLFSNPTVLFITSAILVVMGLIPNMPHFSFLLLAAMLAGVGGALYRKQQAGNQTSSANVHGQSLEQAQGSEATWEDVSLVDPLALEVGYKLVPLVDVAQDGELLHRIRSLRKKYAQDMGFLPPVVHIRDNLELKPDEYRLLFSGVEMGRGQVRPGQWLAINPDDANTHEPPLSGEKTTDPAFGLPAVWIEEALREQAQISGHTVVDAATVIATHLNHLMHRHGASLLGREQVQQLLEHAGKQSPGLTDDLIPKTLNFAQLQRLLRGLLEERVPVRDMRSIVEAVFEHAPRLLPTAGQTDRGAADETQLLAATRIALGRAITQQCFALEAGGQNNGQSDSEILAIGLEPGLEAVLMQALGATGALEPNLADNLLTQTRQAVELQENQGQAAALVVAPALRLPLSRFLRHHLPQLTVLSSAEIPAEKMLRFTAWVGEVG